MAKELVIGELLELNKKIKYFSLKDSIGVKEEDLKVINKGNVNIFSEKGIEPMKEDKITLLMNEPSRKKLLFTCQLNDYDLDFISIPVRINGILYYLKNNNIKDTSYTTLCLARRDQIGHSTSYTDLLLNNKTVFEFENDLNDIVILDKIFIIDESVNKDKSIPNIDSALYLINNIDDTYKNINKKIYSTGFGKNTKEYNNFYLKKVMSDDSFGFIRNVISYKDIDRIIVSKFLLKPLYIANIPDFITDRVKSISFRPAYYEGQTANTVTYNGHNLERYAVRENKFTYLFKEENECIEYIFPEDDIEYYNKILSIKNINDEVKLEILYRLKQV